MDLPYYRDIAFRIAHIVRDATTSPYNAADPLH